MARDDGYYDQGGGWYANSSSRGTGYPAIDRAIQRIASREPVTRNTPTKTDTKPCGCSVYRGCDHVTRRLPEGVNDIAKLVADVPWDCKPEGWRIWKKDEHHILVVVDNIYMEIDHWFYHAYSSGHESHRSPTIEIVSLIPKDHDKQHFMQRRDPFEHHVGRLVFSRWPDHVFNAWNGEGESWVHAPVPGPWWDHIKNVLVPELTEVIQLYHEKAAKEAHSAAERERSAKYRDLDSWSPKRKKSV